MHKKENGRIIYNFEKNLMVWFINSSKGKDDLGTILYGQFFWKKGKKKNNIF